MTISSRWQSALIRYGTTIIATLLATFLRKLLDPLLQNVAPFATYYAAVMFTAWYGGFGPSLLALFSGAALADYLFIEPHLSLFASNLEHQIALGLYLAVGVVVTVLSESLHASRRRIEAARAELAEANRELQKEIADRRQAERWLLESEQRFRGYFEQGLVGMAMLSAEKVWIEANHRICQMLGYSQAELMSASWADLVYPDDLPAEEARFQRMLAGVVQGYVTDHRFVRKNGKVLYASLSAQCLRKSDGAVDCVLVLVQDIGARKPLVAEASSVGGMPTSRASG